MLKQSTAVILKLGKFVDDTDGSTAETGLTIIQTHIQISKNGGALTQTSASSPTTTHDAAGWYQIPLTVSDTDTLGSLTVVVDVTGALPVKRDFMVVPAAVYDALVSGTGNGLRSDLRTILGTAPTETTGGRIADNLSVFFDNADADSTKTQDDVGGTTPPTAGAIADAVWDEAKSGHTAAGSFGEFFMGMTKLSSWLGFLMGKTADTTTKAEVNATTAGASADNTTDSIQAIRDQGDVEWITYVPSTLSNGTAQTFFNKRTSDPRELVQNDDYLISDGRPLRFIDDGTWGLTSTQMDNLAEIKVRITDGTNTITLTKSTSVSDWVEDNGSGAGTATIVADLPAASNQYVMSTARFELQVELASGSICTLERSTGEIFDDDIDPN